MDIHWVSGCKSYCLATTFWLLHKNGGVGNLCYLARGFNYQRTHRIFILQLGIIGSPWMPPLSLTSNRVNSSRYVTSKNFFLMVLESHLKDDSLTAGTLTYFSPMNLWMRYEPLPRFHRHWEQAFLTFWPEEHQVTRILCIQSLSYWMTSCSRHRCLMDGSKIIDFSDQPFPSIPCPPWKMVVSLERS